MLSDKLTKQLHDFSLIKIKFGKQNNIYFDVNLNSEKFNSILENYTKHYKYKASKRIEYCLNNEKLVVKKDKKYLIEHTLIDNQFVTLDNFDILITNEEEKKSAFSDFSCTKDFHNIQNIESVKILLNDYCELYFNNNNDINSITIVIKNTSSKNNKLNINELSSFISNLVQTIQKQLC